MTNTLCSILANDLHWGKETSQTPSADWISDQMKQYGMNCLQTFLLTVYGMEMKRENSLSSSTYTGRRMREVWTDEGKEDEELRREWERRWREAGDAMNEEDVMETCIMHLCIPDHWKKEKDGLIVPSECSSYAVSVLLNEIALEYPFHFPVYDINAEPSNVVIIRNLPSGIYDENSEKGTELRSLIQSICPVFSINQSPPLGHLWNRVFRVKVDSEDLAMKLLQGMNGRAFHGSSLKVTRGSAPR